MRNLWRGEGGTLCASANLGLGSHPPDMLPSLCALSLAGARSLHQVHLRVLTVAPAPTPADACARGLFAIPPLVAGQRLSDPRISSHDYVDLPCVRYEVCLLGAGAMSLGVSESDQ